MFKIDLEKLHSKSYKNIADISNKSVIVRSCLNVAVDSEGKVTDPTRLNESMPLIKEIAQTSKNLIIVGHLGRPAQRTKDTSFWNIAELMNFELSHLGIRVELVADASQEIYNKITTNVIKNTKTIFLLENIRYFKSEESKVEEERVAFAKHLASMAEVFINDAFADYRESASTYEIAKILPSYLGPVFLKEVEALSQFTTPAKPFVAVLGGAKLSEKIDALKALAQIADKVLIGGAMAYTLLKAKDFSIGKSLFEEDKLSVASEIIEEYGEKIVLPVDHLVASEFSKDSPYKYISDKSIPEDFFGIDIGWATIKLFKQEIANAKSILWNGPMGVFEWPHSAVGTQEVGLAMSNNKEAFKLAGGGDSIAAINSLGLKGFNHISTGGGAMLAFLAYDRFNTLDVIVNEL